MLDRPANPHEEFHETFTGNRGLDQEEPLLFEIGRLETTGVDVAEAPDVAPRLGGLERKAAIGLPGLSEPETMRHYVRLSRRNYSIDAGLYPLGSCTMKHNPRVNEKMARLDGFADIHPLQPVSTVQGALALDAGARALADDAHQHPGHRAVAQGRRAWRTLRHDGDQIRHRGARRGRVADCRAHSPIGAWDQSGDSGAARFFRAGRAGGGGWNGAHRGRARGAWAGCRGDHAHQPEHLRPVRTRDRGDRRRRA